MDRLEIASIGVGHGDATLLVWRPEESRPFRMLVDGGPRDSDSKILKYLKQKNLDFIDLLVLSHVDADHIDGLLQLTEAGNVKIGSYWGPCIEAFERYGWLFPERIKKGLEKARKLQEILIQQEACCIYPYEGYIHRTPDRKLCIRVLWPAGRLLERLLLGKDVVDLFTRYPMPQGWLLPTGPESPEEEPRTQATLRSTIRASSFLKPDEIPELPSVAPYEDVSELAECWASKYGLEHEFFGNPVLNDTSLVLEVDALLDGMRRRTVLLPGDLENWLYLTAKHSAALDCDVLKVPHHGGRVFIERNDHTAYDEIYQWLRPRVAIVSATGRHHLPRAKFRETVQRWGATLFCPCRRRREIVIGDCSEFKSCKKVFNCEHVNNTTTIELTATTIEADAPACSSEVAQESARVVRMIQHVIEPSDIVMRMTEGELDKHIGWLKKQLADLHMKRPNIDNWRTPANAVEMEVLKHLAQEEGRYLLVAEIETVLKEAHRRGRLWYHPGDYKDPAKA